MSFSLRNLGRGLGLCSTLLLAQPAWSQTASATLELQALQARTTRYSSLALAADGRYLVGRVSRGATPGDLLLFDRNHPKDAPVRIGPGHSPTWSPDGRTLAYLSDPAGSGQDQVCILTLDGLQSRVLTELRGYLAKPAWSRNGQWLACLLVPGSVGGGPATARPPQIGEIEATLHNQRIAVLDPHSGALHFGSPENLHVYGFDWSPDGRLAMVAAPGPGDNNWWIAQLFVADAGTGQAQAIYKPHWQLGQPSWSPDGTRIAVVEGLMSDEGAYGGDLMVVPAAGGPARNLTPGRASSVTGQVWRSPAQLVFTEEVPGGTAITEVDLGTGTATPLWQGAEEMALAGDDPNLTLAADGRTAAAIRHDFSTPPEIWTGPIGRWQPLTQANHEVRPLWGRAESLTWSNGGQAVQGWLIHPAEERPGQRYPMIVDVHGGPSSVVDPSWGFGMGTGQLSCSGYFILLPNPRGSFGRGEAFTQGNVKDFGGGDLRDILAGVDAVLARYPVDPARLGVQGWSYGGYMTMWAVTQTRRFKAAVAGAGIANWKSYYGENAIDQWMIPFFGASVYDDPAVYAKSSPIEFITQARTPTLVVVGERDAECPAPQSFEFWHGLKAMGVPTRLLVYPGEGHGFEDPEHARDAQAQTLAWFNHYLNPPAPAKAE